MPCAFTRSRKGTKTCVGTTQIQPAEHYHSICCQHKLCRPMLVNYLMCRGAKIRTSHPFRKTAARTARLNANLSQEKLAEIAELHRNYVGLMERGESNVSLLTLVSLARALGVRPAKLIEPIH